MAMNLGGAWDPDLVTTKHLDGLAKDFGLPSRVVIGQAKGLMGQVLDTLPKVVENYGNRYGESPALERLPIVIRKLIRRVKSQLQ